MNSVWDFPCIKPQKRGGVLNETQFFLFIFLTQRYYPHTSRESMSPVHGILEDERWTEEKSGGGGGGGGGSSDNKCKE